MIFKFAFYPNGLNSDLSSMRMLACPTWTSVAVEVISPVEEANLLVDENPSPPHHFPTYPNKTGNVSLPAEFPVFSDQATETDSVPTKMKKNAR
jgi:hypothetical protein